jgi:hypothetical protein
VLPNLDSVFTREELVEEGGRVRPTVELLKDLIALKKRRIGQ